MVKKPTKIIKIEATNNSRPARVSQEAHDATPELCALYAKELGLVVPISRTDAISRAVLEALRKRQPEMESV